jgi:hypothetical protein
LAQSPKVDVVGDDKRNDIFEPNVLPHLANIGGIANEDMSDLQKRDNNWTVRCLKQVDTYAWLGKTRYAFIFTPTSMTFLRYFLVRKMSFCVIPCLV